MATTEKILNTRIQLKYDTLSNWNSSTFKLKVGELAIVSVGEMKDGSTHTNAQYPVLFKVGTGNHTFAELPFASALAADVYSWAKAADVKLVGKTIQFVDAGGTIVKSVELNYVTESEAKGFINDALKSYSTTAQMEAAIKVEADRATGIENGLNTRIGTLEGHIGDDKGGLLKDVADLKTAIGENGSVSEAITTAIEALDSTASQTAGDDGLALNVTLVDGKVTAITGSIAKNTYDAYGSAQAAQSAAEGYADGVAATAKSEAIAAAATETENQVKALADGQVKTNKEAIDAINAEETGILAQAKAYTNEVKEGILGEGITETYDTLVEIQSWINGAGVDATELTEAIAAEAKLRGEEDNRLAGLINNEVTNRQNAVKGVQDQIDALGITGGKVANAGTADVANSLSESAKAEVKAVKVNNATNADEATHATNADKATDADKLGGVVAGNYLLKTDAPGYGDILTKTAASTTYEPVGAESRANAYADGLASNYATSGQGAKADTALQSIEADSGLTVSTKADNKQTIGFDSNVVFVFDCGNASDHIN